jgi:hypothetical protein
MEKIIPYWRYVPECTVPTLVHWSIHGALCCSIDTNPAVYFVKSKPPWKVENGKSIRLIYTVQNTLLPRISENTVLIMCNKKQNFFWSVLTKQEQKRGKIMWQNFRWPCHVPNSKMLKHSTSGVATLPTISASVLSTVFEIHRLVPSNDDNHTLHVFRVTEDKKSCVS